MKKIFKGVLLLTLIAISFSVLIAADFSSYTVSTTREVVSNGKTNVHSLSILNPGSDSIFVFLYDLPTTSVATYTTTPKGMPFYCPPHDQIYLDRNSFPSPQFTNGIQIRAVVRGTVTINSFTVNPSWGSIRTSTVSPTYKPQVNINYYPVN